MSNKVNDLQITCVKCKVASTCPRRGSSPMLVSQSSKKYVFCKIVGGYGRDPVDKSLLSQESIECYEKNGPCLTIAYIPTYDKENDMVVPELTKIFSQPVKHPRETIPWNINLCVPKGGGGM